MHVINDEETVSKRERTYLQSLRLSHTATKEESRNVVIVMSGNSSNVI